MHKQWQWLMLNTNRQCRENDDETGTTHTTIYGKCHACSRCVCAYEANFVLSFSFNIRDMAGVCCCHRKSFSVYNEWECNFWRQITLKIETKTLRGAEAKRQVKRKAYARTHACYSQGSQHAAQIYTLAWTRDGCERMGKNDDDGGQQKRNQTHHQPTGDIVKSTMMSGLKLNAWQRCGRRFRAVHSCVLPMLRLTLYYRCLCRSNG